jgi:hypothetical protein
VALTSPQRDMGYPLSRLCGHAADLYGGALFVAESFGWRDSRSAAGGQCAGEERADSEERSGEEQTPCGEGALHPAGEDDAKEAVECEAGRDADGGADERDAGGNPQHMHAGCTERKAHAELGSALRDAVSDDAEDADQSKDKSHGGEDAEEDGKETLATPLRITLEGFAESGGAFGDLLIGSNRSDCGANGVQVGKRIALGADEELRVGRHQRGVWDIDRRLDGSAETVVAAIADDADDLAPAIDGRRSGEEGAGVAGDVRVDLLTDAHAILPREALVHDGDRAALAIFGGAPDSAGEQRNA